ncbi:hypothetical protein CAPTEDRAFT_222883 [Capitella teleta]|uniref:Uncharacterized protein n=1 Tax=Capitella teleta TaxID=283909 RepID=R7U9D3_CAPTE|nr:hypothetical protein CAPTEDRAFT_222883 [Capitella teleta]|eukprot:ELU02935.1 hypothetical protein CAPTEDRAFT_222883 [Capitella teleta]
MDTESSDMPWVALPHQESAGTSETRPTMSSNIQIFDPPGSWEAALFSLPVRPQPAPNRQPHFVQDTLKQYLTSPHELSYLGLTSGRMLYILKGELADMIAKIASTGVPDTLPRANSIVAEMTRVIRWLFHAKRKHPNLGDTLKTFYIEEAYKLEKSRRRSLNTKSYDAKDQNCRFDYAHSLLIKMVFKHINLLAQLP